MTLSRKQFMMCIFLIFLALKTVMNIKIHLKIIAGVFVNIHLIIKCPLLATTIYYYPVPELFEIHCIMNSIIYLG